MCLPTYIMMFAHQECDAEKSWNHVKLRKLGIHENKWLCILCTVYSSTVVVGAERKWDEDGKHLKWPKSGDCQRSWIDHLSTPSRAQVAPSKHASPHLSRAIANGSQTKSLGAHSVQAKELKSNIGQLAGTAFSIFSKESGASGISLSFLSFANICC